MKLRDILCGLAEVQRAWLYSVAVLDFIETYERKKTGAGDGTVLTNPHLGAFVWNDSDASKLFDVGIPVYYIRSYNAFSTQVIRTSQPMVYPHSRCLKTVIPPYPVILRSSQAGCDSKFAAICHASICCFDVASPFLNMHLPGLYTTSYSSSSSLAIDSIISPTDSIPSTSTSISGVNCRAHAISCYHPYGVETREKSKDGASSEFLTIIVIRHYAYHSYEVQSPQETDDRFRDCPPNEYLPPVLSVCASPNGYINIRHPDIQHSSGRRDKLCTLVPDPALFFGSNDRAKWQRRIQTWSHIRRNWITQCASGKCEPVAASTWKTVLTLGQLGPWDLTRKPEKSHQREQEAATLLVSSTFNLVGSSHPAFPIPTVEISAAESRGLMRELSLVNFRHQLRLLDGVADCSAPKPSPGLSNDDLGLQVLNHRRRRDQLLARVFGLGNSVEETLVCNIFADTWANRVESLRALSQLMDTWLGNMLKEPLWD
ncbi:hypothetical protein V5O48_012040 [Marasmius crinis-equi]|uniref:Uncharacterized protein n=1 Tax=Marasmius crinis-equi TaxID=585013 RepID=A0ABR3F3V7_9AGAR